MRHLSPQALRAVRDHGPMAFWEDAQLQNVEPYRLEKPNLWSDDIFKCPHCGARLFEEESQSGLWCCGRGAYNVLQLPPLDAPFYSNRQFLERARAYNDMMAFCAMRVTGGYRHPSGISFFKIEGRLYHRIYSVDAPGEAWGQGDARRWVNHCKLWLSDPQERRNLAEGRDLRPAIIDAATSFLLANNPFVAQYRMLNDVDAATAHLDFEVTSRATHGPVLGDRNPGVEVHAAISTDERLNYGPRRLSVWRHGDNRWTTIDSFSPLLEPLQYPLLYPHGDVGWFTNRLDRNGKKLSLLDYTRCLLLSEPRFSDIGRLSQAWQVEQYCRFQEEKLLHVALAQGGTFRDATRLATVADLQRYTAAQLAEGGGRQVNHDVAADVAADLAADETVQGQGWSKPPGKIFLPSTHVGSPRYMKVKYLNAMGLVSRKGGPTYFLTFTACGQWDELRQCIRHGDKCDPVTCCRVFHIKLKELLRDIRSGALFGPKAYIVYVIEMQMRGLPHAHIAIRVADGGPTQGRDIDKVIRADIPGPEEAGGRLRPLVLKHMLHGPCGPPNRTNLPCWDDKKQSCNKYYPKPHCETTHTDSKGFVMYKRDHDNKATTTYRNREVPIHDGWIVPYNPFLLLKYEAHINLEVASTRKVIKYLFKYLHKGNSKANVRAVPLTEQVNEPEEYATTGMIGASDACWRLLGFDLTASEPTVTMLPVHLKGQQVTLFKPGEEAAKANAGSKLLQYFNRPLDPIFDNLTYQEFHEQYIIHTKRPAASCRVPVYECPVHPDRPDVRRWVTERQRGECVTRIFWVSPNRGELYYLRVLLQTLPGRSYEDMIAHGGLDCTTFQEAARNLGLCDNEREYAEAIREAATFMLGPRLRDFFVMLANVGAPAALLWADFRDRLCEDYLERHPDDPEKAYKLGLIYIDRSLRRNGSSLVAHGLPDVRDDSTELGRHLLSYSQGVQRDLLQQWEPLLTPEQRQVLDHIKALVEGTADPETARQKAIGLLAPGGYGKTFLLKVISAYLRSVGKVVLCVATSGIAALNMDGGSTAHSMFKLPLDLGDGSGTWNIHNNTQRAELVAAADLIIFDEAPMAHRKLFEMLDRSFKDLMGNDEPFGGKIFLCSGDFRQIPPVVEEARTSSDIVSASLKSSHLWPLFKVFQLTVPQRTRGSDDYSAYLLSLGDGLLPTVTFGEGREAEKLVPLIGIRHEANLNTLIETMYPPNILQDPDRAAERAILSPLNTNVREVNDIVLKQLPSEQHQLLSFDQADQDGDDGFPIDQDTLHLAQAKGAPDHVLTLKTGAVCLITRNLNIDQGLVNGTKVIVEAIHPRLIRVRKPGENESFGIPRISFKFPILQGSPLQMTRRQFPLQLAYAMTIHKSQGQTIKQVGVDLRTDCFAHGQLYVAMSRVRLPDDIRVLVQEDRVREGVPYAKNIVYQDLLLDPH